MKKPYALALVPLILAACTPSGPSGATASAKTLPPAKIESGKEAELMPLAKGNRWTYSYEQTIQNPDSSTRTDQKEMEWTVLDSRPVNGGTRATIEVRSEGKAVDRQVWHVDKTGIYQVSISKLNVPYEPMLPVLRFPLDANRSFKWKGTGIQPVGVRGSMSLSGQTLDSQEVDTEVGRFSAIPVKTKTEFPVQKLTGVASNTAWFKPGLGLVRYRSEAGVGQLIGVTVLRLKSTNLKTQ